MDTRWIYFSLQTVHQLIGSTEPLDDTSTRLYALARGHVLSDDPADWEFSTQYSEEYLRVTETTKNWVVTRRPEFHQLANLYARCPGTHLTAFQEYKYLLNVSNSVLLLPYILTYYKYLGFA